MINTFVKHPIRRGLAHLCSANFMVIDIMHLKSWIYSTYTDTSRSTLAEQPFNFRVVALRCRQDQEVINSDLWHPMFQQSSFSSVVSIRSLVTHLIDRMIDSCLTVTICSMFTDGSHQFLFSSSLWWSNFSTTFWTWSISGINWSWLRYSSTVWWLNDDGIVLPPELFWSSFVIASPITTSPDAKGWYESQSEVMTLATLRVSGTDSAFLLMWFV